ncbi:MAG: class I SAM-dependent methyltransferase [Terriglobia bacterium]
MDYSLMAVKLGRRLRSAGVRRTLRDAVVRLRTGRTKDEFDQKYGTDTGGMVPLWKFKITSPNARFGVIYQTAGEQEVANALNALPEAPGDFTFVDVGCGKGRTLLIAARLGFKQVIGVEFVHELAEVAKKNLQKMQIGNATVLEMDAAAYRFPDDDLVVYFCNPFSEEVMSKVIANLRESLAKRIYVVYLAPVCAALFDASGFLTRLAATDGERGIQVWKSATQS